MSALEKLLAKSADKEKSSEDPVTDKPLGFTFGKSLGDSLVTEPEDDDAETIDGVETGNTVATDTDTTVTSGTPETKAKLNAMNKASIMDLAGSLNVLEEPGFIGKSLLERKAFLAEMLFGADPATEPQTETDAELTAPKADTSMIAAAKASAKSMSKAVEGIVMNPATDIITVSHQIEKMKDQGKIEAAITGLLTGESFNDFVLGGLMTRLQEVGHFGEYGSFKAYIEAKVDIKYRKATYLMRIYEGLVQSGVAWEKVAHIGWTKLKEIAPILNNGNADHWIGLSETMNTLSLSQAVTDYVKNSQIAQIEGPDEDNGGDAVAVKAAQPVQTITTKTFKLHEDQVPVVTAALEKAKEVIGTDNDTVALEHISLEYTATTPAKGNDAPLPAPVTDFSVIDYEQLVDKIDLTTFYSAVRDKYPTVEEAVTFLFTDMVPVFPELVIDVTPKTED